MKTKVFKKVALAAAVASIGLLSVPANAGILNSILLPGENTVQDTDAERILRANTAGGYDVVTSGIYAVGDIIQAAVIFDTLNGSALTPLNYPSLSGNYQLVGISELEIASITWVQDVGVGDSDGVADANDVVKLTFAAAGLNLTAGSLVDIYERTTALQPVIKMSDAPGTTISNILSLTPLNESLSLTGNDFWFATAVNTIGALLPGTSQVASGVFGVTGTGDWPLKADGMLSGTDGLYHDIVGSASVYARDTNVNTGWLLSSNFEGRFNVPEPGSLALAGMGLLAALGSRRRRS